MEHHVAVCCMTRNGVEPMGSTREGNVGVEAAGSVSREQSKGIGNRLI